MGKSKSLSPLKGELLWGNLFDTGLGELIFIVHSHFFRYSTPVR